MAARPGRQSARGVVNRVWRQSAARRAWRFDAPGVQTGRPTRAQPDYRTLHRRRPSVALPGPLLFGFEFLDADVAELQFAAFTLEADEAFRVLQIVGGADDFAVEPHLAARAGAGHLEGLPLLRRLEQLLRLLRIPRAFGTEDVGHARAVLALHLVAPVGPVLAFLARPDEDAAVLLGIHPAHFQAQDEVVVLLLGAQPAAAARQLDDAVLRDELRLVHHLPALERFAVEQGHEPLLRLRRGLIRVGRNNPGCDPRRGDHGQEKHAHDFGPSMFFGRR